MPTIEIKKNISRSNNVSTYKEIIKKAESCRCPYCKKQEWSFAGELEAELEREAEISMRKDHSYKPTNIVKAKCKSCGYVAYFHN